MEFHMRIYLETFVFFMSDRFEVGGALYHKADM